MGLQEIVDGVIVALLLSIGAFVIRKFRTLDDVYNVVATRKPSDLEPHPPKGIIDQMLDVTAEAAAATAATGENTNAVLAMSVRQGQANGTAKDIQAEQKSQRETLSTMQLTQKSQGDTMEAIQESVNGLHTLIENVVEQGSNVKLDLDVENAKKATVASESQHALLEAIGHGEVDGLEE